MKDLTKEDKKELFKLFEEKKTLDQDETNLMARKKAWGDKLGEVTGHKGNLNINDLLLGVLSDETEEN